MNTVSKYNEDEKIYININLRNPSEQYIDTRFTVNETSAILPKASDYAMWIERFTLDLTECPIAIFPHKEGSSNVNEGAISFSFDVNGTVYTANTMYSNIYGDLYDSEEYYFIYSYKRLIEIFNTAISTAFSLIPSGDLPDSITEPPFFIYSDILQKLQLICQFNYSLNNIKFYTNRIGAIYLDAFVFSEWVENSIDLPNFAKFDIKNENMQNAYVFPGQTMPDTTVNNPPYLIFTTEYSTLYKWDCLRTIYFESYNLGNRSEYIQNSSSYSNNETAAIVMDFEVDYSVTTTENGSQRGILNYNAIKPRLINLKSDSPLYNFDIQVYWISNTGKKYKLKSSYLTYNSIKIAFSKNKSYI